MLQVYAAAALVGAGQRALRHRRPRLPAGPGRQGAGHRRQRQDQRHGVRSPRWAGRRSPGVLFQWLTAPDRRGGERGHLSGLGRLPGRHPHGRAAARCRRSRRRGWVDGVVTGARDRLGRAAGPASCWSWSRSAACSAASSARSTSPSCCAASASARRCSASASPPAASGALAGSMLAQPMARRLGVGPGDLPRGRALGARHPDRAAGARQPGRRP